MFEHAILFMIHWNFSILATTNNNKIKFTIVKHCFITSVSAMINTISGFHFMDL